MKSLLTKIISVLIAFTLCIGLCACNKDKCATGHTWQRTSTTATCYDGGIENYTCKVCKTTKTENVSAYGHDLVTVSFNAPTCKTTGLELKRCSRCSFESGTTLLQVDHDYEIKSTTPSTCTVKGSQTLECSMCHETKNEQLPLAGHNYELKSTTDSTCIAHGHKYYQCKDCTDSYSEELPFADHKYKTATKEATCFTHGGTVEKCSVCQDEKPTIETPLLEHNFGANGYCTKCGIYETLFAENGLNVSWGGTPIGTIRGSLLTKFKNDSSIPDIYWQDHTVTLTISMYNTDGELLEAHSFDSATIPHEGANYGKLTIQYMDTEGGVYNGSANGFVIFLTEGNKYSLESRTNCKAFKIELSCDGYKAIEKTYNIT